MRSTRSWLAVIPGTCLALGPLAGCAQIAGIGDFGVTTDAGLDAHPGDATTGGGDAEEDAASDSTMTDSPLETATSDDASAADAPADQGTGDTTCVSGSCSGVCAPNQAQCNGQQPQACGEGGVWQNSGSACGVTQSCINAKCVTAPSCQASGSGLTNCGTSAESCCTSLEISGGTYYRTYTNAGSGATAEADQASVSGFRLDKYDVTVGRFRRFVAAWNNGSWLPQAGSGKHTHLNGGLGLTNSGSSGTYEPGWLSANNSNLAPTTVNLTNSCNVPSSATWTSSPGNQENLPINCVNWWEAYAFCIWDEGFLPSEAEWEYAAAGGSQQREYPWGSAAPGTANQYAIFGDGSGNCYYPSNGPCQGIANIAPVGLLPMGAGLWGQVDLAGNMWQWTLDWYASSGSYADPCTDCAYLTADSQQVYRGGNFASPQSWLLSYSRGAAPPGRYAGTGFRCARTP